MYFLRRCEVGLISWFSSDNHCAVSMLDCEDGLLLVSSLRALLRSRATRSRECRGLTLLVWVPQTSCAWTEWQSKTVRVQLSRWVSPSSRQACDCEYSGSLVKRSPHSTAQYKLCPISYREARPRSPVSLGSHLSEEHQNFALSKLLL